MPAKICPCCHRHPIDSAVRLAAGWEPVCRDCAEYIHENAAPTEAPGVVLRFAAAQAAFDAAFVGDVTVAEALAIAEPVERAIRDARRATGIRRGLARRPGWWTSSAAATL